MEKKYASLSAMLLNPTAPLDMCVNQLLAITDIDNTPVNYNRYHKLITLIRKYHETKM